MKRGAAVLLEGAQGSLLDIDHGTYPFVTSSSTTSGGAAIGVGIAPDGDRRGARRGEGVHDARRQRAAADGDGRAAGRARCARSATSSARRRAVRVAAAGSTRVVVRYATRVNGLTDLAVTKLDVLDTLDRVGDLHRLRVRRRAARRSFPATSRRSSRSCRGTSGSRAGSARPADARTLDELPAQARALSRPDRGAGRGADHVRQRRDAARSDHRAVAVITSDVPTRGMPTTLDLLIVGAGPCGLAAAISAQRAGLTRARARARRRWSSTITQYPDYVSSSRRPRSSSLGGRAVRRRDRQADAARRARVLPRRRAALRARRAAVRARDVDRARRRRGSSCTRDSRSSGAQRTRARAVVRRDRLLRLAQLSRRAGRRAAARDARLSRRARARSIRTSSWSAAATRRPRRRWICGASGARVTLVHFGPTFDKKIKPWVLPDFENREKEGSIGGAVGQPRATRSSRVRSSISRGRRRGAAARAIRLRDDRLRAEHRSARDSRRADRRDDGHSGARSRRRSRRRCPGVFIAGVVVAGYDANKVFIENGRFHGDKIVARLLGRPRQPPESAERARVAGVVRDHGCCDRQRSFQPRIPFPPDHARRAPYPTSWTSSCRCASGAASSSRAPRSTAARVPCGTTVRSASS